MSSKREYLIKNGVASQAIKQGKKQREKDVRKKNKIKDICLNCTKEKCNGNCAEYIKQRGELYG